MDIFYAMLLPVIAGMLLLCIGYSYREHGFGVLMIWFGIAVILGTTGYKIIEKLS